MPARRKARSVVGKAGGLDDVGLDAEAGAQAKNRSGILRNIGLVEGDAHDGTVGRGMDVGVGAGSTPMSLVRGPVAHRQADPEPGRRMQIGTSSRVQCDGTLALVAVRVPIKRRRIASPLTSPRSDETGLPLLRWTFSGAVRSADGVTGKTEEGVTGGHNLRSAAFAARCFILWTDAAVRAAWRCRDPATRLSPPACKSKLANA